VKVGGIQQSLRQAAKYKLEALRLRASDYPDRFELERSIDVEVRFYPEETVNDDGQEIQVPAENRDAVWYIVPFSDVQENGGIPEDNSHELRTLKDHENAPDWVQEWTGPFRVTTN